MKVTVCCITYNHKKYIKDALEGFINQVTDFEYEVLVHDDASTDGTAGVVAEYAKKYPDIIKPIFQDENQYSKGSDIWAEFVYPRVSGKYIALCEGDDYWCDHHKLQKQVDFLENHEEYSACVHNTRRIQCRNHNKATILYQNKVDRDISLDEVIESPNAYFHTSSIMFQSKYKNIPHQFKAKGFGDYPLEMYLALEGKIHYFKDVMSVYRLFAEGSYTSRYLAPNGVNFAIEGKEECIRLLNGINEFTNYEYHQSIARAIRLNEYYIEGAKGNFRTQLREYKDVVNRLKFNTRMKLYIKCLFPVSVKIKEKLKNMHVKNQ